MKNEIKLYLAVLVITVAAVIGMVKYSHAGGPFMPCMWPNRCSASY